MELPKEGRIEAWIEAIDSGSLFETEAREALFFSKHDWEQQKEDFEDIENAHEIIEKEVYKFYQVAMYHRDYTLKQLLPKHGIAVL